MTFLDQLKQGVTTRSAEETRDIAARLAVEIPLDATLALHGDLGAGKTTLVQGLAKAFGVADAVTSPTFTIFTLHRGNSRLLVHLDAYRLENEAQIDALMLEDFLSSPYCLAIEWPEKIAAWIPPDALHLDLRIVADEKHYVRLR